MMVLENSDVSSLLGLAGGVARCSFGLTTQESRFTMHIQTERKWLGKSFETSNRERLGLS